MVNKTQVIIISKAKPGKNPAVLIKHVCWWVKQMILGKQVSVLSMCKPIVITQITTSVLLKQSQLCKQDMLSLNPIQFMFINIIYSMHTIISKTIIYFNWIKLNWR